MDTGDIKQPKGLIFDIKKFAVHDGPGIRTTVFFKGCPLNCWWCHNPEAIHPKAELVRFDMKCIGCGECFAVCPEHAHEMLEDGTRTYHRDRCRLCGSCAEICYAEALVMEGRSVTVEEVMAEVRKDMAFYENSGGGVTLSGGEPLFQPEFVLPLLKQCKEEGFHTVLDTSGQVSWKVFSEVLPYLDLVLYDMKQIDDAAHRIHTGVSNRLSLRNLERLGGSGVPIEIRMPVVPGINDDRKSIEQTGRFLSGIDGIGRVQLLPFHKLGESKYARLGREYRLKDLATPDEAHMEMIAGWIRSFGLEVAVGK